MKLINLPNKMSRTGKYYTKCASLFYDNLTHVRFIWTEGTLSEKVPTIDGSDVGGACHDLVVLGAIRKEDQ